MAKPRWKFTFKNKTDVYTRHLSALVRRLVKTLPHKLTARPLVIEVCNTKGGMSVRYSLTNPPVITLRLPGGSFNRKLLCCFIAWCLGRINGFKGRDLSGSGYYDQRVMAMKSDGHGTWTTTGQAKYEQVYAWADSMPLDRRAVKGRLTGAALALKKAEQCQDKVNEWEGKVKKANTILKKWQRRLRYHEQRAEKLQIEWAKSLQGGTDGR